MKKYFKTFGPFRYFKSIGTNGYSAWLKGCENCSHGFEWGWRDPLRGQDEAVLDFRIGKLSVLYFETWKNAFELHILGFWWIK